MDVKRGKVVKLGSKKKTGTILCELCRPEWSFDFVLSAMGSEMI